MTELHVPSPSVDTVLFFTAALFLHSVFFVIDPALNFKNDDYDEAEAQ